MFHLGSQRGASLIGALVSVGILGLMATLAVSTISTAQRSIAATERRDEIQSARMLVRRKLDCEATLVDAQCDSKSPLTLRDRTGKNMLSGAGTLGRWKIRATCDQAQVTVEYVLAAAASGQTVIFDSDARRARQDKHNARGGEHPGRELSPSQDKHRHALASPGVDWQNLFGEVDPALCLEYLPGTELAKNR